VFSPQPAGVYQLFVKDLLHENYKSVDIAKIRILFSGVVVERILATPLVGLLREDKLVWEEERNGLYSVKSSYKLPIRCIIRSDKYHVAGNWNSIWKAQALQEKQHLLATKNPHKLPKTVRKCIFTGGQLTAEEGITYFYVRQSKKE
jgi:hypothetical protein